MTEERKILVQAESSWSSICRDSAVKSEMSIKTLAWTAAVAFMLSSGTLTAQTVTSRVRVTAGKRIHGRLVSVDGDALTLMPDGRRDPIRIPLSSISAAEVSEGKRSRAVADFAGVGIGFGAGLLTGVIAGHIAESNCRNDPSCHDFLPGLGGFAIGFPVGGIATGILAAHLIGRERWRSVPVASLRSLVP
jgi:hypothetical protein